MEKWKVEELAEKIKAGEYSPRSDEIAQAVSSSLDRVIEARKRIRARVDEVVNADREAVRQHYAVNDMDWTRAQLEALGK